MKKKKRKIWKFKNKSGERGWQRHYMRNVHSCRWSESKKTFDYTQHIIGLESFSSLGGLWCTATSITLQHRIPFHFSFKEITFALFLHFYVTYNRRIHSSTGFAFPHEEKVSYVVFRKKETSFHSRTLTCFVVYSHLKWHIDPTKILKSEDLPGVISGDYYVLSRTGPWNFLTIMWNSKYR